MVRRRVRGRMVLKIQVRERNVRRKKEGIFLFVPLRGHGIHILHFFLHRRERRRSGKYGVILLLQDFHCHVIPKKNRAPIAYA